MSIYLYVMSWKKLKSLAEIALMSLGRRPDVPALQPPAGLAGLADAIEGERAEIWGTPWRLQGVSSCRTPELQISITDCPFPYTGYEITQTATCDNQSRESSIQSRLHLETSHKRFRRLFTSLHLQRQCFSSEGKASWGARAIV